MIFEYIGTFLTYGLFEIRNCKEGDADNFFLNIKGPINIELVEKGTTETNASYYQRLM